MRISRDTGEGENGLDVTVSERLLAFAVVAGIIVWLSRPWLTGERFAHVATASE